MFKLNYREKIKRAALHYIFGFKSPSAAEMWYLETDEGVRSYYKDVLFRRFIRKPERFFLEIMSFWRFTLQKPDDFIVSIVDYYIGILERIKEAYSKFGKEASK